MVGLWAEARRLYHFFPLAEATAAPPLGICLTPLADDQTPTIRTQKIDEPNRNFIARRVMALGGRFHERLEILSRRSC